MKPEVIFFKFHSSTLFLELLRIWWMEKICGRKTDCCAYHLLWRMAYYAWVEGQKKLFALRGKAPEILNSKEAIIKLFIQKGHEICMHLGVEYTRNYIQQRCYIIGFCESLRSLAFSVEGFECRRLRALGLRPPMADLPEVRFQDSSMPAVFTNVGLDYLGPFAVMHRDKEVKTYICLFTCLFMRAIHLEIAENLSTEKCITAIRRFISGRGQPRVLMSHNATNFLGSRRQLRRKPLQLDHDFIRNNLLNQSIEWKLNPPSAPHYGGVWGRLVQIVKRVLPINLGSTKLTPDVFSTIVTEAECLVNSRPLTHVRSDNKDDDPLTPIISSWDDPLRMCQHFSFRSQPVWSWHHGPKSNSACNRSGNDCFKSTSPHWIRDESGLQKKLLWKWAMWFGCWRSGLPGESGH